MANLKEVRSRISSVNSTQQITKAMKMVSAAKLKRAVDASSTMAPYSERLRTMMAKVLPDLENFSNVFSSIRPLKKVLLIVITSNRGLAGAFNANIIRLAYNRIQSNYSNLLKKEDILLLPIGKKGFEFFKRKGYVIVDNPSDIFNSLHFSASSEIANKVMSGYINGEWDHVEIFYNRFKNAALQIQENLQLIPIKPEGLEAQNISIPRNKANSNYIFEPTLEEVVDYLIPESICATLYSALLSSFASEHGARMTSMDKATENAAELLKALKLQYNRARQASITNEILEIVSGANAMGKA